MTIFTALFLTEILITLCSIALACLSYSVIKQQKQMISMANEIIQLGKQISKLENRHKNLEYLIRIKDN